YDYRPLQVNGTEIRLIELAPSKHLDDELHCRLIHVDLRDFRDQYEAVSYTWGTTEDPEKLIVDADFTAGEEHSPRTLGGRQHISITANLALALKRFRRRDKVRLIWADGASIDQFNPDEKFHQIPIMQDVYESAFRVLVWIGDAEEEGRKCMDVLR
ncbi:uncharacterized protein BDZ99DRAFT_343658, partial [Mytilinidion resinicola]